MSYQNYIARNTRQYTPDIMGRLTQAEQRVARQAAECRSHRDATTLWNRIDALACPEHLWDVMGYIIPWAFGDDRDCNSIIFED